MTLEKELETSKGTIHRARFNRGPISMRMDSERFTVELRLDRAQIMLPRNREALVAIRDGLTAFIDLTWIDSGVNTVE